MPNEDKLEKVLEQRRLINATLRERRETEDGSTPRPPRERIERIDRKEEGAVVSLSLKEA